MINQPTYNKQAMAPKTRAEAPRTLEAPLPATTVEATDGLAEDTEARVVALAGVPAAGEVGMAMTPVMVTVPGVGTTTVTGTQAPELHLWTVRAVLNGQ